MSTSGPPKRPLPETGPPPFTVRLHPLVSGDLAREKLKERLEELYWFIAEFRQLEYWPLSEREQAGLAESLGIRSVDCRVATMYAAEFAPTRTGGRNYLVYFWVDPHTQLVWILHIAGGALQFIRRSMERRACRRLTDIKGYDHDRRTQPERHGD